MSDGGYILTFTVDRSTTTVTPDTPQAAGVRGDNGAARLIFQVGDSDCTYRLEIVDGSGGYDITEPLPVTDKTVVFDVPAAWTAPGIAAVRLVELSGETVRHFPPVRLLFADREEGQALAESLPRWQQLLTDAEEALDEATDIAQQAAQTARFAGDVAERLEGAATLADEAKAAAAEALERSEGVKGVYVGSGEMPPEYNVQIDPSGQPGILPVALGGTGTDSVPGILAALGIDGGALFTDEGGCLYRTVDGETEWLIPPMEVDVEYRLAQRWKGQPVYAKVVDFGALPDTEQKSVSIGIVGTQVVDMTIHLLSTSTGIYHRDPRISTAFVPETKWQITNVGMLLCQTAADMSKYVATAVVKYIKK